MKVVLYLRYSSEKQNEQSIEGQDRICREYCARQGYDIVCAYIDRATSAFKATDKRTQFQRMISDSSKRLWEGVVVYKLDRFARNRYDSATYKARLKKNGVRVISATENISDNPEGIILESVLEGMAEYYSLELSQKVKRGMYEGAMHGTSLGGQIPLGYKTVDKKFVIDEAGAAIVREAFDMYIAGMSANKIAQTFNERGYRSSTGAPFNDNSFRTMFKNKRYLGIYKYKDMEIPNAIPAIITQETWDKAQARMALNRAAPARGLAKVDYLLSQKIFCGECGRHMAGTCGRSGGNGNYYYYYQCPANRTHECHKKTVKKEWIERIVIEDAYKHLTPEMIETIADKAVEQCKRDLAENTLIPTLEADIAELQKRRNNYIQALAIAPDVPEIAACIRDYGTQIKEKEAELARVKSQVVTLERDEVIFFLSKFLNGDIEDKNYQRQIVDLFVSKVIVYDLPDGGTQIRVDYNVKENPPSFYSSAMDDSGSPFTTVSNLFVITSLLKVRGG